LSSEIREAFLLSQLQAGLKLSIMESPAIPGSLSYKPLCVAEKQEEKCLMELCRRKQQDKNTDLGTLTNSHSLLLVLLQTCQWEDPLVIATFMVAQIT